MREYPQVIQFVGFETPLSRDVFLTRWEPFAASFLSRGIERLVLGEGDAATGFRFVSRNVWPDARFRAVFSSHLPGDAGGGAVTAVQVGAFRLVAGEGLDVHAARRGAVKNFALVRCGRQALQAVVSLLIDLGRQHGVGGWATYAADPRTRGGRFNAALEVYGLEDTAQRFGVALAEALQRPSSLVEESQVQLLREILELP